MAFVSHGTRIERLELAHNLDWRAYEHLPMDEWPDEVIEAFLRHDLMQDGIILPPGSISDAVLQALSDGRPAAFIKTLTEAEGENT